MSLEDINQWNAYDCPVLSRTNCTWGPHAHTRTPDEGSSSKSADRCVKDRHWCSMRLACAYWDPSGRKCGNYQIHDIRVKGPVVPMRQEATDGQVIGSFT